MNYDLILWLTGIMLLTYWFVYVIGSPLTDDVRHVDVRAILFAFPLYMADRRVRQTGTYEEIEKKHREELQFETGVVAHVEAMRDWKRYRLDIGRRLFTWEKSLLCPICLHFWLTLLFGAVCLTFNLLHARQDLLLACFIYLLNHFFIRKIS